MRPQGGGGGLSAERAGVPACGAGLGEGWTGNSPILSRRIQLYLAARKHVSCLDFIFDCEITSSRFGFGFQYKRAAAAYDRAGRMSDAVKLHETLYDFRRAIQLLVDNNRFDDAIDVLKRYEMFNKVTVNVYRLIEKLSPLKLQLLCKRIQSGQREEKTNAVIEVEV